MAPSLGRIVIFQISDSEPPQNSSRKHPAIITAVHDKTNVNLMVFFDNGEANPVTSVLHESIQSEDHPRWRWPDLAKDGVDVSTD